MNPDTYFVLKQLHRLCALLSIAGFTARWLARLGERAWVHRRAARTLPHGVDTVLLATALLLAWSAGFTPANSPWLLTKILLLLVYIGLGMIALSPRRSTRARRLAGMAAIVVFAHIVSVAWLKHPAGLLSR